MTRRNGCEGKGPGLRIQAPGGHLGSDPGLWDLDGASPGITQWGAPEWPLGEGRVSQEMVWECEGEAGAWLLLAGWDGVLSVWLPAPVGGGGLGEGVLRDACGPAEEECLSLSSELCAPICRRSTPTSCRPRSAATRRCSASGSGASTSPPRPLCRPPPRCPGAPPSLRPPLPPPGPFGQVQLSVREPRGSSCPSQGAGVRGDRCWRRSLALGVHTSWL